MQNGTSREVSDSARIARSVAAGLLKTGMVTLQSGPVRLAPVLGSCMSQGGETLHAVAAPALKQLYEHGQLRHILTHPDDERMRALLEEAERLCTDLLEAR
jgi:hypothetical protein